MQQGEAHCAVLGPARGRIAEIEPECFGDILRRSGFWKFLQLPSAH